MIKLVGILACALLVAGIVPAGNASDRPAGKLLYLVVDGKKLIASNIHFNRIDELRLQANEQIEEQIVADAVAIVATNQRIIAYSVYTAAWRPMRTRAGEAIEQLDAEDFGAQVLTSGRILNFNGRNGIWAEVKR